jgi:hypothetical protein
MPLAMIRHSIPSLRKMMVRLMSTLAFSRISTSQKECPRKFIASITAKKVEVARWN